MSKSSLLKPTHGENGILGITAGAHQPTFFSLQGPAKALHQQARKTRELSVWMGFHSVMECNGEPNVDATESLMKCNIEYNEECNGESNVEL